MKYRIIGDIHGRHNWHNLIEPYDSGTTYIFIGDYTDPYYSYEEDVTYEGMLEEINNILEFKRNHPDNVILLYGNHDMQYVIGKGDTNRYDVKKHEFISALFEDNKDLFHGVAYQIGNKYLITHAGVTKNWYEKYFGAVDAKTVSLDEICKKINKLWDENKYAFTFSKNRTQFSDDYGTSPSHSPVWIRPESLWQFNIFGFCSDRKQIVGHTPFEPYSEARKNEEGKITTYGTEKKPGDGTDSMYWFIQDEDGNICYLRINNPELVDIIFCDCLRTESACVEVDENMKFKKII